MAATDRKPLKIAFVHNKYINYRIPFFEGLAENFDVTFLFDQVDRNTEVHRDAFSYKILRSITAANTSTYELRLSPTLFCDLLKSKYDLFIGSDMGAFSTYVTFIVSRLTRKPFILWNETWYWPMTVPRLLVWFLVRIMMLKADAIVVPGSKAREFVISNYAYPGSVFIAPNASNVINDTDLVSYEHELKKKLGIEGKKVVLYLGRLVERKGVSILIKAFFKLQSDVNDTFLVVVGEGKDRINLERLCAELKLDNVIFTGYVDDKYKGPYYSLADVFVLPSVKHTGEVWDLVLNEAMSFAKPIVSTTAAGSSYDLVMNSVNGYMVKEGDVHDLYKAIKTLLMDSEKAKKMGLESKKIIKERFSIDHMVEGFTRAINYVASRHHHK